jgi:hypothetical protein
MINPLSPDPLPRLSENGGFQGAESPARSAAGGWGCLPDSKSPFLARKGVRGMVEKEFLDSLRGDEVSVFSYFVMLDASQHVGLR